MKTKYVLLLLVLLAFQLESVSNQLFSEEKTSLIDESVELTSNLIDTFSVHKTVINKHFKKCDIEKLLVQNSNHELDNSEFFYILVDLNCFYRFTECTLIEESEHAYFYVENSIMDNFDIQYIEQLIGAETEIFEEKISPNMKNYFGSQKGILGDIGNGKTIILYANLPSGVAGYYDPFNEFPQSFIDINYGEQYKSNEWEMIYLDFFERYETTLAHEFQHLIHFNHDLDEERWIDEGFSELAGFLTRTQPEDWKNITPFAQNYFRLHPEDSLLYWNLYSQQYDVRIDYGGVYLFSLYFYERFGSLALKHILSDETNGAESLDIYLNSMNTSFNEFFSCWQIALTLDNFEYDYIQPYSYNNINFTVNPDMNIREKNKFSTINIPYYGIVPILIDLSDEEFDVSLYNSNSEFFSITIIILDKDSKQLHIENYQTSNQTIKLFSDFKEVDKALVCISAIDFYNPLTNGGIGVGDFKTLSIQSSNPYDLSINNPKISHNESCLSIQFLSILLMNGTDIYFSEGTDMVVLSIRNETSNHEIPFYYDDVEHNGWNCYTNIENLQPGFYNVFLHASSGEYQIEILLYEFTIEINVNLNKPEIFISKNKAYIKETMVLIPSPLCVEIIGQIKVYAFIYNKSENYITNTTLHMTSQNTWEGVCNLEEYDNGEYFTIVILEFGKQLIKSHPSNISVYSKNNTISITIGIVGLVIVLSVLSYYSIVKRRWR